MQPRNAQGKIIPQGFQERPDNEQQDSKIAADAAASKRIGYKAYNIRRVLTSYLFNSNTLLQKPLQ